MVDPGANMSVFNFSCARDNRFQVVKLDREVIIRFGDVSRVKAEFYTNTNSIIGRALVLDDKIVRKNILAIDNMTFIGYFVIFGGGKINILDKDWKCVAEGYQCSVNKLYYIKIKDLLNIQLEFEQVVEINAIIINQKDVEEYWKLHARLGHISAEKMIKSLGCFTNVPTTADKIRKISSHLHCDICKLASAKSLPIGKGSGIKPLPGQWISFDFIGVINPTGMWGIIGFWLFIDVATGFANKFLVKNKYELIIYLTKVLKFYRRHNWTPIGFRFDAGSVENSEAVQQYILDVEKLESQPAIAGAQFQNPVERSFQTLKVGTRKLIAQGQPLQELSRNTWPLAVIAATEIMNDTANINTGDKSPRQIICKSEPIDLNKYYKYPFGQKVAVMIPVIDRSFPFPPVAEIGYVVSDTGFKNKGFILFLPGRKKNALFNRLNIQAIKPSTLDGKVDLVNLVFENAELPELDLKLTLDLEIIDEAITTTSENLLNENEPSNMIIDENVIGEDNTPRRSTRFRRPNQFYSETVEANMLDWNMVEVELNKITTNSRTSGDPDNPKTKEALNGLDGAKWRVAADEEFESLLPHKLDVGALVDEDTLPPGTIIEESKMVFKKKYEDVLDDSKARYKARCAMLGNLRWERYRDTYSAVASSSSFRLFTAISVILALHLSGFDIVSAFNHTPLPPGVIVYMREPKSTAIGKPRVIRLKKSICGMPESSAQFFDFLFQVFTLLNYKSTSGDKAFLFKRTSNGGFIMCLVETDDVACAYNAVELFDELRDALINKFEVENVKITNKLVLFIGIQIIRNQDGSLTFLQLKHIKKVATKYFPTLNESTNYPLIPISTTFESYTGKSEHCEVTMYRSAVNELGYFMNSRPEVLYAFSIFASRQNNPTNHDYNGIMLAFLYIIGTKYLGLTFNPSNPDYLYRLTKMFGFVDAGFLTHSDSKSQSGWYDTFDDTGNGAVNFKSNKQSTVASSSTQSENNSLFEFTKSHQYMRDMMESLGFTQETASDIWDDSANNIQVSSNPQANLKGTKHYMMRVNYILEQIQLQVIKLHKISSLDNHSDIFTKALPYPLFAFHRSFILGIATNEDIRAFHDTYGYVYGTSEVNG